MTTESAPESSDGSDGDDAAAGGADAADDGADAADGGADAADGGDAETADDRDDAVDDRADATRYEVALDRDACDGIFACLVRDDRFREAADGLATVETASGAVAVDAADADDGPARDRLTAEFEDDRLDDAHAAAAACPVDAISVEVVDGV